IVEPARRAAGDPARREGAPLAQGSRRNHGITPVGGDRLRTANCGLRIADFGLKVQNPIQSAIPNAQSAIRNPQSRIRNPSSRRQFLSAALLLPATAALSFAADPLCVLKPNDVERLKLDFNSNRDSVRLLFVLSPTLMKCLRGALGMQ